MKCKKCEHELFQEDSMCSFCGEEVKKENFFQKIRKKFSKKEKTEKKKSTPAVIGTFLFLIITGNHENLLATQKLLFPSFSYPFLILLILVLLILLIMRFPKKSSLIGGIFIIGMIANGMFLSGHIIHQDTVQEKNMKEDVLAFAQDIENGEIHEVENPQSNLGVMMNELQKEITILDEEFLKTSKEYDKGLDLYEGVKDKILLERRLQVVYVYKESSKKYNQDTFDIQMKHFNILIDKTEQEEIQKMRILRSENMNENEKKISQESKKIRDNQHKEWEQTMKEYNKLEGNIFDAEMKVLAFLIKNYDALMIDEDMQEVYFSEQKFEGNFIILLEKLSFANEEYAKYVSKKQESMMNKLESIKNM